jgi:hypothetical protein
LVKKVEETFPENPRNGAQRKPRAAHTCAARKQDEETRISRNCSPRVRRVESFCEDRTVFHIPTLFLEGGKN